MSYVPEFAITPALFAMAGEIAVLRERIHAAVAGSAALAAFQMETRCRAVHATLALEGNPLSSGQVRDLEEGRDVALEDPRHAAEVRDAFAGLRHVEKLGRKPRLLAEDIQDLHRILAAHGKAPLDAGQYRTIALPMGRYLPPPPHIPTLLAEFLDWWNRESGKLPHLLSSAILHYRLEAIHPFAESNGLTSRALSWMELQRRGFDPHRLFPLDEVFLEDGAGYVRQLDAVQKAAENLSAWMEYCAESMRKALDRAWTRLQALVAGRSEPLPLRPRQEELLRLLRDRGGLTPRAIRDTLGVSRQGAMDLLNPLLDAGIVEKRGGLKTGQYALTRAIS